MQQPHTEQSIEHSDGQQDTGNHKIPGSPDAGGADRFGGTRTGADNVEHVADHDSKAESVESGPDLSRVSGLDEVNASEKAVSGSGLQERSPERDERGRI